MVSRQNLALSKLSGAEGVWNLDTTWFLTGAFGPLCVPSVVFVPGAAWFLDRTLYLKGIRGPSQDDLAHSILSVSASGLFRLSYSMFIIEY